MRALLGGLALFVVIWSAEAQGKEPSGFEVAERASKVVVRGFKGQKAAAILTLFGGDGAQEVSYKLLVLWREGATTREPTRSLVRFLGPPNLKGTALLTHEDRAGTENRWMYLSESRTLRQISGANKSGAFVGSEFAYEDLAVEFLHRFSYKMIGQKRIRGRDSYQVEERPTYDGSGYGKVVSYFDKEHGYWLKTDFFDRAGQLLKTAVFDNYERVNNLWRAHYIEVTNHQTKRKSTWEVKKLQLGVSMSDKLFSVANLRKQ